MVVCTQLNMLEEYSCVLCLDSISNRQEGGINVHPKSERYDLIHTAVGYTVVSY